jgi:hypothetical protein
VYKEASWFIERIFALELGVVVHIYNPSIQEAVMGGL